jgi:lipid II:glycine glycyltransferase (peptidoglycan interpeptide bridge formation enzyme)
MTKLDSEGWNTFVNLWPKAHLLQAAEWGELKSSFGWEPVRLVQGDCGAQILYRKLPFGFSVAYIPKGPIGANWNDLWPMVHDECKKRKSIFLHVEPDLEELELEKLKPQLPGFLQVDQTIQPRQTILIDLDGSPEDWLSRMKQKTRYNIRLAQKKAITIKQSDDLGTFESLMKTTGSRDGFGVHSKEYYEKAYSVFSARKNVILLQAEYDGKPLAMLMGFFKGKRAYYLYGASSDEERQRMPAYLLQFEAMRWAADNHCTEYDLWGIPDTTMEDLESNFETRSDGLWGVYRFKRGFGGRIFRSSPGFDYVYMPILYNLLQKVMNRGRGASAG